MRPRPVLASAVLAGALLLGACAEADEPTVDLEVDTEVEPTEEATPEDEATEEPDAPAEGTEDEPTTPATPDDGDADASGPLPDQAALDDPCGPHEGREADAFIDVVAPVEEQQVSGDEVELVGCSNVYEATVQWDLYDGDGRLLDEGFTTAECGSGCVGAFRDTVDLSAAAGEPFAELHVYSEDASDGSARFLTAVPLVLQGG